MQILILRLHLVLYLREMRRRLLLLSLERIVYCMMIQIEYLMLDHTVLLKRLLATLVNDLYFDPILGHGTIVVDVLL